MKSCLKRTHPVVRSAHPPTLRAPAPPASGEGGNVNVTPVDLPPPGAGGVARRGPGWVLGVLIFTLALIVAPAMSAPKTHPVVEMVTSKGLILIKLYPEDAPISCANFIKLANKAFYNGTKIHRVADLNGKPGDGHIVQGGSPLSKKLPATDSAVGGGGPGWTIKGEFPSNGVHNPLSHNQGAFAMARSDDPDSAGSQFYIVVTPATFLNPNYAVFGQVISGIDVANQLVVGDTIRQVKIVQGRD